MKFLYRAFITAIVVAAPLLLSCAADDPTRVDRPPVVSGYSPASRHLNAFVGDTLHFSISALDPDRGNLSHTFTLGDSVVTTGSDWEFAIEDTGSVWVRGLISDGSHLSTVEWIVVRHRAVNLPPAIVFFSPAETSPRMIIGTSQRFTVEGYDPNNDVLDFTYTVDDTVRGTDDELLYEATSIGDKLVRVFVSDGESAVTHDWMLTVTGVPDTVLPAPVVLTLLATGTEPGEADVEWTAVGKNGMEGLASIYRLRTSPSPIRTEYDWVRASPRTNVPAPLAPGETMGMTINDLVPASEVFVAVRAVDDFGNESLLANTLAVFSRGMRISGVVRNAVSNEVMSDVHVRVGWYNTITDVNGFFEFIEMPPIDNFVYVSDDNDDDLIGDYFDFVAPYVVKHLDQLDLYLIPATLESTRYTDFYAFLRAMTDLPGGVAPSGNRRWVLPVDLYVKPYVGAFDYKPVIEQVARDFDDVLGAQVFNIVDAPPVVGVYVEYGQVTNDRYHHLSFTEDGYPIQGKIVHRTTYPVAVNLQIVTRHELGHAIGLQHSADTGHVMLGGNQSPSATAFASDEVNVIKIRYNLPRGLDLIFFRRR